MRSFDIDKFKGTVTSVGRPTHYEVMINLPPFLRNKYNQSQLTYRAVSTNIPSVDLELFQVRRAGVSNLEDFPYNKSYGALSVSFICDDRGEVQSIFQEWIDYIFPISDGGINRNFKVAYKTEYATDMTVTMFDSHGRPTLEYLYENAFPATKSDVNLNWGSIDDILTLNVNFKYSMYRKRSLVGTEPFTLGSIQSGQRNNISVNPIIK